MNLPNRRPTLFFPIFLVLFELLVYLSNDMYLPALPQIRSDLQTSEHLVQMTLTSWFLGAASFNLLLGPISDRFGRKPVLLASGIVFVLSSYYCGISSGAWDLIAARFFQGTAVSAIAVCGYATVHELFDEKRAVAMIAWMSGITVIAPAFGPVLGGVFVLSFDWRLLFHVLAILSLLDTILIGIFVPESNPASSRRPLQVSSVMATYRNIVLNRDFCINTVSASLLFAGAITWIVTGPFLIMDRFGYGTLGYGLLQLLVFSGFIGGAILVNILSRRQNLTVLVNVGLAISFAAGCLVLSVAYLFPDSLFGLIAGMMVFSCGNGMTFASFQRAAVDASTEPAGAKMAVFATSMVFFSAIGAFLAGVFYDGTASFVALSVFIVATCVCAIHLWAVRFNMLLQVNKE